MIRKEVIEIIAQNVGKNLIVSANGFISRDLFEVSDNKSNFYMIGSMGLASSIGLGIAIKKSQKTGIRFRWRWKYSNEFRFTSNSRKSETKKFDSYRT